MIIGLSGKKQSGKDTVAKIIQYLTSPLNINTTSFKEFESNLNRKRGFESNWQIKRFADKLKNIVCLLINCTREQLEDNSFKEKELGEEWRIWYMTHYKLSSSNNIDDKIGKIYSSEAELKQFETSEFFKSLQLDGYEIKSRLLTPRLLLQLIGTECGRNIIHSNLWVNSLMSEYRSDVYYMCDRCDNENISKLLQVPSRFREQGYLEDEFVCPYCKGEESEGDITKVIDDEASQWIITDVRFPNEAEAIRAKGGLLFRINREGLESSDKHESETALDNYLQFTDYIRNDSTIGDLVEEVKSVLTAFKII